MLTFRLRALALILLLAIESRGGEWLGGLLGAYAAGDQNSVAVGNPKAIAPA